MNFTLAIGVSIFHQYYQKASSSVSFSKMLPKQRESDGYVIFANNLPFTPVYFRWYFGKIKRTEAEKKLQMTQNEHGAFLIRDSESRRNDYSLSVRDGDTVKHYRIRPLDEGGFWIARRQTFRTLQELVDHYTRDADGLCVNLRKPCIQVSIIMNILYDKHTEKDKKWRSSADFYLPIFLSCALSESNQLLHCSLHRARLFSSIICFSFCSILRIYIISTNTDEIVHYKSYFTD